jgi:hypothetical protein
MATPRTLESFTGGRSVALSVVDALAQAFAVSGEFPPPIGDVTCEAIEALAPAPGPLDPALVLSTLRTRSGVLLLDGWYVRDGAGGGPRPLAAGTYRVRVAAEAYQDAEFVLSWPPAAGDVRVPLGPNGQPGNVLLLPAAAYPVPDTGGQPFQLGPTLIRGTALAPSGDPLPRVLVEALNLPLLAPAGLPPLPAWPFFSARSDDRGGWMLVLPDRRYIDPAPEIPAPGTPPLVKDVTVRVHSPTRDVDRVEAVTLGGEHAVRNTALRGQVAGPGGRPIAGAVITTSLGPAASRTRADGLWFLYLDLDQPDAPGITVTATAPGGAQASSPADVVAGATVVVPAFRFN